MSFFLTLITPQNTLTPGHLERALQYLDHQGISPAGNPLWLAPHRAADIPLSGRPHFDQMQSLRRGFMDDQIDVIVSPAESRRKTLLFADMDSTIVTTETLDELAVFAGVGDQVAEITQGTMNGTIDFYEAIRLRVGMLKGLPEATLKKVLDHTETSPGVELAISVMKRHGAHSSIVSSGFTYFTAAIAARCGFDDHFGNIMEIAHGALTGHVPEPILDKEAKRATLLMKCEQFGVDPIQTLAIGDGSNDIPMLQTAGLGIAYHPRPIVAETIDNQIIHTDFTSILFAQGYTEADIRAVMN